MEDVRDKYADRQTEERHKKTRKNYFETIETHQKARKYGNQRRTSGTVKRDEGREEEKEVERRVYR